jgi:arylformamidase
MTNWIDISMPLYDKMLAWPDDPQFRISRMMDLELGDSCTLSSLQLNSHTGTHVDAPLHYIEKGTSIDLVPLDVLIGKSRVIGVNSEDKIYKDDISDKIIRKGQRILFKTRNSNLLRNSEKFNENFVYLSKEAARYLVDCQVSLVGIDYLSVEEFNKAEDEIHHILLEAGIWIIEGLDLSEVVPGEYELNCLPLKLIGADGAPARAVLKRLK